MPRRTSRALVKSLPSVGNSGGVPKIGWGKLRVYLNLKSTENIIAFWPIFRGLGLLIYRLALLSITIDLEANRGTPILGFTSDRVILKATRAAIVRRK